MREATLSGGDGNSLEPNAFGQQTNGSWGQKKVIAPSPTRCSNVAPPSLEEEVDRSFARCVLRKKGGSGGNVRRPQLPDMGTVRTGLRFMLELHRHSK